VGRTLDERYRVVAPVAEGGFGVVYRAQHGPLDRPVALKVLKVPEDLSPEACARAIDGFVREARTLATLEHPAIARVLDYGTTVVADDRTAPWMVLEWIEGETLAAHLDRRAAAVPPSPEACLALLRPVFEALALAHDRGVVHRDVKPANIMLTPAPPGVRLLDFGIAKQMAQDEGGPSGETRTRTAAPAFSLGYAAPEQLSGTRTGPWTDVHALALVLSEVLTGRAPYSGDDDMALYLSVLSTARPTPALRGRDVGQWEPVLARALALMPGERFPDARAFLDALDATSPASAPDADAASPVAPSPPRRLPRRALAAVLVAGLAVVPARLAWRTGAPPSQRALAPAVTPPGMTSPTPTLVVVPPDADAATPTLPDAATRALTRPLVHRRSAVPVAAPTPVAVPVAVTPPLVAPEPTPPVIGAGARGIPEPAPAM
jgi:serine/threonine protein kinase